MPKIAEQKAGPASSHRLMQSEVVLGRLAGFDDVGAPLVDWPGNPSNHSVLALSTAACEPSDRGRIAALLFADGDPARPVIVGLIRPTLDDVLSATTEGGNVSSEPEIQIEEIPGELPEVQMETRVDGERVVVEGQKEIVLKCGKASITLTRAGKILIRGEYLLSRSAGANQIKGGTVQLN